MNLRKEAAGRACLRCGAQDETVVGAHYTGVRRLDYGGGFGKKVHDLCLAPLCAVCHQYMDTKSRDKSRRWEHSEEFQHYILLHILRLAAEGKIKW